MRQGSLAEVISTIVIVLACVVMAVPPIVRVHRTSLMDGCRARQSALIKAQYNFSCNACCRRREWSFHHGLGGDWWKDLYQVGEIDDPSLLWCRCRAQGLDGETNFRGPALDPNRGGADSFVGADRPDNHWPHEPINAVSKSGDVVRIDRGSGEFDRAMKETKP